MKTYLIAFTALMLSCLSGNAQTLFRAFKVDGKYELEIPDPLLDREMLVVTRMVKAPAGLTQLTYQYGGEELSEQVWKWTRHNNELFIKVPGYIIRGNENSQMAQAVANSNLETIIAAFEIKSRKNGKSSLIAVDNFFNSDAPANSIPAVLKKSYKLGALDNSRSFIDTIRTFPMNVEVRTVKTYAADNGTGALTFELNTSMLLLPTIPAKPRIADARIGLY